MKKVAKLVYYSMMTRVVVDENATDEEIIDASYKNIQAKLDNKELGENLEEIDDDGECPFGTFDTDDPSIDKVILNVSEKTYLVMGKGLPLQIKKFENFSDWDTVKDIDGEQIFDVQIDEDEDRGETVYCFQYVNLIWDTNKRQYTMGHDWMNPKELIVTEEPMAQVVANLFQNNQIKLG